MPAAMANMCGCRAFRSKTASISWLTMTGPASLSQSVTGCSSRSSGSTRRATRRPAGSGSASPSPATWRAAMAATSGWKIRPMAACAPGCTYRGEGGPLPWTAGLWPACGRDGRGPIRKPVLTRGWLARQGAHLVEAFVGALVQDLGGLGAGLGRDRGDLAAVLHALFQHLLHVFGVLGDPVLGRGRRCQVAPQRREPLEGLARQLDMTLGDRLHALDGELVGLAQRLDVAALRRPRRLDIEGTKAEIGKNLGHVEIEWVGTSISHRLGSDQGLGYLCDAQSLYRPSSLRGQEDFAVQQRREGRIRPDSQLHRAVAAGHRRTSARCRAAAGRAPPWSARGRANRRAARPATWRDTRRR